MKSNFVLGLFFTLLIGSMGVLLETPDPNGLSVEFVGASPKFKVYPNKDQNSFFLITMGSLVEQEVVTNGPPNRITGLASDTGLVLYPPAQRQINTTTGKQWVYSVDFSGYSSEMPSTWIDITTYITSSTIQIPYGNETLTIPEYSFKWGVNITDWPFKSQNNSLALTIGLTTSGGNIMYDSNSGNLSVSSNSYNFVLQNPSYAFDGSKRVPVNIRQSGNNLIFAFPSFNSLYYDPVVSMGTTLPSSGEMDETAQLTNKFYISMLVILIAYLYITF